MKCRLEIYLVEFMAAVMLHHCSAHKEADQMFAASKG